MPPIVPEPEPPEPELLPPTGPEDFAPPGYHYDPNSDQLLPDVIGRDEAYENIRDTEGITYDPFASELLWTGFFDPDATPDERYAARQQYFDYMGYSDSGDFFAWDEWRDWYESAA